MKQLLLIAILLVAAKSIAAGPETRAVFLSRDLIQQAVKSMKVSRPLRRPLRKRLLAALNQESCADSLIQVILKVDVLTDFKRQLLGPAIADSIRKEVVGSLLVAQACDTISWK